MNESKDEETIYDRIKPQIHRIIAHRIQASDTVLDIGCGDCQFVNLLAKHAKSKVIGIDIDRQKLADGLEEAVKLGVADRVKCLAVDAHSLPKAFSEEFDVGVSIYALHEYENPIRVLLEVNRALKPAGKIILVDYLKGSTAEKLWSERYYTPKQIKSLLKKARFRNIETEYPEGKELIFIQGIKM